MLQSFPNLRQLIDRASPAPRYPGLQAGHSLYVVGDIHGRLDCLREAHESIDRDRERSRPGAGMEVYLGDYVDRGPDSHGVIDCLIGRGRTVGTVLLAGNHERMMQGYLKERLSFSEWQQFGGAATLLSYGVERGQLLAAADRRAILDRIPEAHLEFLDGLRAYHVHGDYHFVHACPEDMWVRADRGRPETNSVVRGRQDDRILVHAHTPVDAVKFRSKRINLDTGAYRTGRLAILKIDGDGPRVLDC